MTSEDGYEEGKDYGESVALLQDVRRAVRSIDRKVEEILDSLKEHFEDQGRRDNSWSLHDLYNEDEGWPEP